MHTKDYHPHNYSNIQSQDNDICCNSLMPKKIRELKSLLLKAGFICQPAKGSHSKWKHPKLAKAIIIAGKDGNDAKLYLEKSVNETLEAVRQIEAEETEP